MCLFISYLYENMTKILDVENNGCIGLLQNYLVRIIFSDNCIISLWNNCSALCNGYHAETC